MERREEFLKRVRRAKLDTGTLEEPKHDYFIDGVKVGRHNGYYGVTSYIGEVLFPPFNTEKAVDLVLNSSRYSTDPDYIYYKATKEEILKSWKDTSTEGSDVHNLVDEILKTKCWDKLHAKYPSISLQLFLFLNTIVKDCIVYASEIPLFDPELKITGCTDALFYNKITKEFILVDWKSNCVKKNAYGQYGTTEETQHLPDCKYYHYQCQVNIYAHMLEKYYGIKCSKLIVVGFGLNLRKQQIKDEETRNEKDFNCLENFLKEIEKEKELKMKKGFMGLAPNLNTIEELKKKELREEIKNIMDNMGIYVMDIDNRFREKYHSNRKYQVDNQ